MSSQFFLPWIYIYIHTGPVRTVQLVRCFVTPQYKWTTDHGSTGYVVPLFFMHKSTVGSLFMDGLRVTVVVFLYENASTSTFFDVQYQLACSIAL